MSRHHTLVALVPVLLVGCGRVPMPSGGPPAVVASAARYPLRADLLAVGNLGAPPRWNSPGFIPLKSVQVAPRTPDIEFVSALKPLLGKEVFDPGVSLNPTQRDDLSQLLDAAFGSPAKPAVKLPGKDDLAKLKLEEFFAAGNAKGVTPKQATAEAAAEAERAWKHLKLDDATLARGAGHYRRWCIHCHGESGAGDGAQAAQSGSYPRDYRQGIFKFVSAAPTSAAPKRGERGKPRVGDLKKTIRNGLDGSIMPGFPTLTEGELDDLIAYVAHLSVRGEAEFETMAKAMKPGDDDPDFVGKDLERLFAAKQLSVLANWWKAEESPIPIPPENCANDGDRLRSAVRGWKGFNDAGCAGCHANYGRDPQFKYDLWGTVVVPRNLTLGVYRGGRDGPALYARLYGGIYPSGMNEHKQLLAGSAPSAGNPDKIWDIVHFLQALSDPTARQKLREQTVYKDIQVKIDP